MDLDLKALKNCMVLAASGLSGERVTASPGQMAELWADIAKVEAYINEKSAPTNGSHVSG